MDSIFSSFWLTSTIEAAEPKGLKNGELRQLWLEDYDEYIDRNTILKWIAKAKEVFHVNFVMDKSYRYHVVKGKGIEASAEYFREYTLNSFGISKMLSAHPSLNARVHFESVPQGSRWYFPILKSMFKNVKLHFTYQSYDWDEPRELTLPVYAFKQSQQRWYMICPVGNDECHPYSLDRVKAMELTDEHYVLPADFNAQRYYSTKLGIMTGDHDGEVFEVEAAVFGKSAKYVKSLPWHHSQRILLDNDTYTVFGWTIEDSFDFRQKILSFGENVVILKPQILRDEIKEILQNSCSGYEQELEYKQKKRRE